jgi:hypothetical protein
MTHFALDPIPDPVTAGFVPLFGRLRASLAAASRYSVTPSQASVAGVASKLSCPRTWGATPRPKSTGANVRLDGSEMPARRRRVYAGRARRYPTLLFGIEEGEDDRGVEDQWLPVVPLVHGAQRRAAECRPTGEGSRSPTTWSLLVYFVSSSSFSSSLLLTSNF